ncbi:HGE-14 family type IV secretion system effector [Anaplasma phagocytophilum]|uniref:HGE-14 family type IV secretion system effector n=1 Tax=Anaplasma phagocytophilum TaxID=948 RepID=UPI00201AD1EE
MHTPRIFTSPGMSGYTYSGISSTAYRDIIRNSIISGAMQYDECMRAVVVYASELRGIFHEIRWLDSAFVANVRRMESLGRYVAAESTSSSESAVREKVLYGIVHRLYDALYYCVTASCNKRVAHFMDSGFIRRGVHLQIANACSILVNVISIVHCCARTATTRSVSTMGESDADNVFNSGISLSAYVNVKLSALSICLNSSSDSEDTKRRKAILLMVWHNIELCNKVAELVDQDIPRCFRNRAGSCLNKILNAVESSTTACGEMVRNNERARLRLTIAKRARASFMYYSKTYRGLAVSGGDKCFRKEGYTAALVRVIGCLFSMYRGYAATDNADYIVATRIEGCLRILLNLHNDNVQVARASEYRARTVYLDMCSVYEKIDIEVTPDLLLNPRVEIQWRNTALRYLLAMMNRTLNGGYFNVVEQAEGSPSQPSTSTQTSVSRSAAISVTTSSVLEGAQVTAHRSRTPSGDIDDLVHRLEEHNLLS